MAARGGKGALAFLTVVEVSQHGACGGLLVLNAAGRPLEFHCTTPVKANRAQEILYGPTLRPYLYGEQIGATLVAKAAAAVDLLCVDLPHVLAVRPLVQVATVLVEPPAATSEAGLSNESGLSGAVRIDLPHTQAARRHSFEAAGRRLAVHGEFASDCDVIAARLAPLADFDLSEPFGRIREAIEEAQRGSR